MSKNAIEVKALTKFYKVKNQNKVNALKNVNLSIPQGSLFGLLGPNGAGKSTFINILAGLVIKTSGNVNVWGFDIDEQSRQVRASIGIVPQELNLDPFFTPEELLNLHAGLYGIPKKERKVKEILELLALKDQAKAYSRALSGGMRRRLLIAKAMIHNPPIIILDEPTAGVDVELRYQLWENVKTLNKNGITIILTTHYIHEAEELCDHIAILNKGELVASDTKDKLLRQINEKELLIKTKNQKSNLDIKLDGINCELVSENLIRIHYNPENVNLDKILEIIKSKGIVIEDLNTKSSDLEDVFLKITKN